MLLCSAAVSLFISFKSSENLRVCYYNTQWGGGGEGEGGREGGEEDDTIRIVNYHKSIYSTRRDTVDKIEDLGSMSVPRVAYVLFL